jgi:chitodextrinase
VVKRRAWPAALGLGIGSALILAAVAQPASAADTRPPTVPTGLVATAVVYNEVDLAWNRSTDNRRVAGYTVYRDGIVIGTTKSSVRAFADRTVSPSTTYAYTVDAFDPAGNHSAQSTSLGVTTPAAPSTDRTPPSMPTGLRSTNVAAREVDLAWNESTDDVGVAGYTVYRDGTKIGTSSTTSFADPTVAPSTTYSYTVDSFDAAQNHSDPSDPLVVTTAAPPATPVEHVVVIDQENHSFDDVLGRLCTEIAAGTITGHDACDGATKGTISTGQVLPLATEPDLVPIVAHGITAQRNAIDGGKMDGFDKISGCTAADNYACYAQFDPSQIPNLAALATRFVISDRTFEFSTTPSWGGHLVLAAATMDGFDGANPTQSTFTTQTGPGWGCDSFKDDRWWTGAKWVPEPSCVPDANGNGPYRASPVPYVPTIFDRLDAAGLRWKIYGGLGGPGTGYGWTICPSFFECLGSSQRLNLVPASDVVTDAQNGALPSLSLVMPTQANSQHNSYSMAVGDNWIGSVVSAIQNGPDWSTTAIFITYDDCGCFYDHVPPPSPGLGIRVPTVIVSPYAKSGFTDSTTATYMSLLAYTEHVFGLAALTASDGTAYDYRNAFDYTQPPTAPVPMVQTAVPRSELRYIADHPASDDDPT